MLPTPTAQLNEPAPWKQGVQWWQQSRATRNLEGVVTGNTPLLCTPSARDYKGGNEIGTRHGMTLPDHVSLLPTATASDWKGPNFSGSGSASSRGLSTVTELLLPTPNAGNFNDGEDIENWERRRQENLEKGINGNGQGTPLSIAVVQLLPTPQAADGLGGHINRSGDRKGEMLLPGVVRDLLPTPRASDGEHGGPNQRGTKGDLMLPSAVQLLPTPRAEERQQYNSKDDYVALSLWARRLQDEPLLPTPVAMDAHSARNKTSGRTDPESKHHDGTTLSDAIQLLPTPRCQTGGGAEYAEDDWTGTRPSGAKQSLNLATALLPSPRASDGGWDGDEQGKGARASSAGFGLRDTSRQIVLNEAEKDAGPSINWGRYEAAILRWEGALARKAPSPTEPGKNGKPRLSPRFVEFMMGLPDGWVTDVPGVNRRQQLHCLGNGCVPAQGALALRILIGRMAESIDPELPINL